MRVWKICAIEVWQVVGQKTRPRLMQLKCSVSASIWAGQNSLALVSHLYLTGMLSAGVHLPKTPKVEDSYAQTGLSSTRNVAFKHPLSSERLGISCFSLPSTIIVKSFSKGMEHLAALILRWLRTKCLKREPLTVQLQAIWVETLFFFCFFFLCWREFESPWAGKGKKEEGCCKNSTGGGSSVFHSPP